jgi:hypothetical protein
VLCADFSITDTPEESIQIAGVMPVCNALVHNISASLMATIDVHGTESVGKVVMPT